MSGVRPASSGLSAYVNFCKLQLELLLHFLLDSFETRYTYFMGQSPNFVLFRILKFGFSIKRIMNFHHICLLKSLLILQFPMDSFETRYTSLGQSSHLLLFGFLKFVCFYFLANFHLIFIQIATAPTIFNGFL